MEALKDIFVSAGTAWIMWLLLALSVGSLAITVERLLFFRTKNDDLRGLVATLDAHLRAGDRDAALRALAAVRSVGAAVASAGLRLADRGPRAAEKGMESAMAIERRSLEARLVYLGTLGNNAPFVGLFGTVIGVILAFDALSEANEAANQVASAAVMGAIAEALVATALGIAVALPAVAIYNYFQRRIAGIMADAEALQSLVVAYLVDETPDARSPDDAPSTNEPASLAADSALSSDTRERDPRREVGVAGEAARGTV